MAAMTIKQYNAQFASQNHENLVDQKRDSRINEPSYKICFKIVFVEVDVSKISGIDVACKQVIAVERKIDFLYMSPGMIPLNGPQHTDEGLEACFTLSYYSRMRLIVNLLPLLRRSHNPRILSVLNAGKEKKMQDSDIGLENKWSPFAVIEHTVTMTSLAFEHLAQYEKQIAFIHTSPGLVRTEICSKLTAPVSSGILWKTALSLIRGLMAVVMLVVGISVKESGDRQNFILTNEKYGPGAWRIDASGNAIPNSPVLEQYKEQGQEERVWEHTAGIFERALSR